MKHRIKITSVLVVSLLFPLAGMSADLGDISLDRLSLQQAEQLFTSNNRELIAAKRLVEGSQADTLSAAQRPNPTLSLSSTNFRLRQSNGNGGLDDKTLDSIIRIDQLIERGSKRQLRMAAADNALKASEFDLTDTVRQQKYALRSAYYDLLLAQDKEGIQQNNVDLYQKSLDAAQLRFKAGDIAATDVSRIRIDAMRAQNDVRQAKADKEKAQSLLAYLIGKDNDARNLSATDNWPSTDDQDTALVEIDKVVDQRPDVRAAQSRVQLADESRQLAESLNTRDITVGVQYEHYPNDSRNTVGAGVSFPLLSNYQYQGEIARSQVAYTSALESLEQVRATATGEITRARADLESSIDKVRRYDQEMLADAKKSADAAEFAYKHGAMDVTDLLDARRVLRAVELDAATVRADYAKSLAAWQAAITPEDAQ
ncbi:transporter [Methylovorus sp. MM2]|uniref:TolC family protein n=1 Tax=Methylovorus sp. MM2 TaxID=1848038 RepID=UPI0007E2914E|nr:TolC family protein [Methylovorus sp. MM2]OAM52756.1 transporter [Methylovorus sp. MM2]